MKLKMIKRSYSLEWKIALLISLGYCGYFLYGYFKNPEIIHDKSIFIGLAIFVSLFVMSLLGLLLGWKKREAINLEGWKYKLYGKNKRLFLLYTGFRIGEMLTIEKANVDLEQMTVKGGIKTKASKDRIVPIHPRIQKFVKQRMTETGKYLFSYNGKKLSTSQYYIFWNRVMDELKIHHTPHECPTHFPVKIWILPVQIKSALIMMGHNVKGRLVKEFTPIKLLRN